jgi:hypothetical protein
MEFKGTKGKWVMHKTHDVKYEQPVYEIDDDSTTEFVTIWSGVNIGEEIPEEIRANALLISKAPELLDMLKDIYQMGIGAVLSEQHIEAIEQLIKESTDLQITT